MKTLGLFAMVVMTSACVDLAPSDEHTMLPEQQLAALVKEQELLDPQYVKADFDEDSALAAETIEVASFGLGREHTLHFLAIPEDQEIGVEERAPLGRATLMSQMPEASVAELYLMVAGPSLPVPRLIAQFAGDDARLRGREMVDALDGTVDVHELLPAALRIALDQDVPDYCERGAAGARTFARRFCGAEDRQNSFCDSRGVRRISETSGSRKKDSVATTAACFDRVEVKHYYRTAALTWRKAESFTVDRNTHRQTRFDGLIKRHRRVVHRVFGTEPNGFVRAWTEFRN